jgi:hypothetical protein
VKEALGIAVRMASMERKFPICATMAAWVSPHLSVVGFLPRIGTDFHRFFYSNPWKSVKSVADFFPKGCLHD